MLSDDSDSESEIDVEEQMGRVERSKQKSAVQSLISTEKLHAAQMAGEASKKANQTAWADAGVKFDDAATREAQGCHKDKGKRRTPGLSRKQTVMIQEDLRISKENVALVHERHKELEKLKSTIERILGIAPDQMSRVARNRRRLQFAKIMFMFVIAGCEMDLDGFALACGTYWTAGAEQHPSANFAMKMLICLGPIGYFGSVTLYVTLSSWNYVQGMVLTKKEGLRESLVDKSALEKLQVRNIDEVPGHDELPYESIPEPVHMRLYHFLPVLRYYLLIKDPDPNDVEALFRVNGLSSFTLGFAQIMCMCIGFGNGSLQWEVKTKLGCFAQVVNGVMTCVYFFTKYPDRMMNSIRIGAYQRSQEKIADAEFERFSAATELYSLRFGDGQDSYDMNALELTGKQQELWVLLQHFRDKVIRDINCMAHVNMADDFRLFPYDQLFAWRKSLVEKRTANLAEDASCKVPTPLWVKFAFLVSVGVLGYITYCLLCSNSYRVVQYQFPWSV